MALIPITAPFAMNDAMLEIGLGHDATSFDDYTEAVSQAQFTPASSTGTWMGIGGNTLTNASPSTWVLNLAGVQDADPAGLSAFLFDNDNARASVRLTPTDGSDPWTANVTLLATAIGGTAGNTPAAFTVTLAVQGRPVRGAAIP